MIAADEPAWAIREATSDEDLGALAAVVNATTPDDPTSLEELRWGEATYPGGRRFLAELEGRAVGAATVGRMYVQPPEYPYFWASIVVRAEARRRGIGAALLVATSDHARTAGKAGLHGRVSAARPEAISFLVRRGFTEVERSKAVRLELEGVEAPPVDVPAGIVLTDLGKRPDLVPGVHAVAVEAFADIPGGDVPDVAGDLAEFRARDVDRPAVPPDAFVVALDAVDGSVIGYASLSFVPGSTTVAWHDMTAVARRWRGRGVAGAMKRATIRWAIDHGLHALETGNDEANGPMRAVNLRLGYQPLPDEVFLRGPLFSGGA